MQRRLLAQLTFRSTTIPGGDPPVRTAVLSQSGAYSTIVRFPPAWRRPSAGAYPVGELVIVLEGALTVTATTVRRGETLWIPPMARRVSSESRRGALCFARFSGPPVWQEGGGDRKSLAVARPGRSEASPFGVAGRRFDVVEGPGIWLLDHLPAADAPGPVEILARNECTWVRADTGERMPAVAGPCWVVLPHPPTT
jgi:hypothetical protein